MKITEEMVQMALKAKIERDITIKEYLKDLLLTLWQEGESFSGKRPLGNSCWEHDIYWALAEEDILEHRRDRYNEIDWIDEETGYALIAKCIEYIFI